MEKVDWDSYFMTMVYLVAMRSKDENTHIGAVIVGPDNEIRSTGYNGFVRDLNDDVPERQENPEKYYWFEHGERNAIYNATLMGVSLKDCRMYTNGVPCMDCARGVVQSGIREVIVDGNWDEENSERWAENARRSLEMFKEVGVGIEYWKGNFLKINKFRGGEVRKI
jgi:dCMP deaminase